MTGVLADALTLLGLLILTVAVYGVLRVPDVLTQLHAASKAGFAGVVALLAAAAVQGDGAVVARAVLVAGLLAVTTPVAAHAIARAAWRRSAGSEVDDAEDDE